MDTLKVILNLEYPSSHDVLLIVNDVAVQSELFGIPEDGLYFKAVKYVRKR